MKTMTPEPSKTWLKTTAASAQEYHQPNAFSEYRGKLVAHEKKLKSLLATVKGLVTASKSMSAALTKCGSAATEFGGSEGETESVRSSLTNLGLAFTAWGKKSSLGPAVLYFVLRSAVEFQAQQVRAIVWTPRTVLIAWKPGWEGRRVGGGQSTVLTCHEPQVQS